MFFMEESNNYCLKKKKKRILIKKLFVTKKNTHLNLFSLSSLTNNLSIAKAMLKFLLCWTLSLPSLWMCCPVRTDQRCCVPSLCGAGLSGGLAKFWLWTVQSRLPGAEHWAGQHSTSRTRDQSVTLGRNTQPFLFSTLIVRINVESSLELSWW